MSKLKRPEKIQTSISGVNGTSSTTSSPSLSAKRPPSAQLPPSSATTSANGVNGAGPRTANRTRRDAPAQLLGRGQRTTSAGFRSASIVADNVVQVSEPRPYVQSDSYILKKYRGCPASLIVHLHPNHFRFDQQDSTFTYKSPMKIFIEHLRAGTVPHDLLEHFTRWNITFYEGCLIVEVHDHKSVVTARDVSQVANVSEKTEPFSIHKWNEHLTPSSWVPYPKDDAPSSTKIGGAGGDTGNKQKTALEKDKENMPAPNQPLDAHRSKSGHPAKKAKISTVVLHPTPLSLHIDLAIKASTPVPVPMGTRRESRVDIRAATPMSASGPRPQTPMLAIPSTPHVGMEPPAKRVKREKMELDGKTVYTAEAQITLATTAPLFLDSVDSAEASARLLEALTHPDHCSKVPSPKTRKKTVAEMAAEESAAADEEQYMLILDERLSSNSGVPGAANPVDGDVQAGSASWEPRFERFKAIESIKLQNIENKKKEKTQQAEAVKRQQQEGEAREKARQEGIKRQQEEERQRLHHLQQQQARQQQQDAQRRQIAHQVQQNQPGLQGPHPMPQPQVQHAHPSQNVMPNGLPAGQQRLLQQQQQFSQAQVSSPIVRNATPHNLSSPMVANNMGVQMQHSTSSLGGSPPRPGSVVQQGHQQMTPAMAAHAMRAQNSQQSHGGTPRLPNATPNKPQAGPRQINQTPRISQSSPMPNHIAQAPHMGNSQMMMQNPQMAGNMQLHQQAQRIAAQQQQQQQLLQAAQQQAMGSSPLNGQMTPQQQFAIQQMQHQQGNPGMMSGNQMSAPYAAQLRQLAHSQALQAAQQNGNQNFMAANGMPPQMVQAQQPSQQHQMMQHNIRMMSQRLYQQGFQQLSAQWNNNVPQDALMQFKQTCNHRAQQVVMQQVRASQMRQQQHQAGMAQNMNMNGMGMQRPPGM